MIDAWLKAIIVEIERCDACISTFVKCLWENETRAGQRQNQYAKIYGQMLVPATYRPLRTIRQLFSFCELDDMEISKCEGYLESSNESIYQIERVSIVV